MRPLLMSTPKVKRETDKRYAATTTTTTTDTDNYIHLAARLYAQAKDELRVKRDKCKQLVRRVTQLNVLLITALLVSLLFSSLLLLLLTYLAMQIDAAFSVANRYYV